MKNTKPELRFAGFTDDWEQHKFSEVANRTSNSCKNIELPRVEYEDINAELGTLNKDLKEKKSTKVGLLFEPEDVLFGKLRPYLKNWLLPNFRGIAVGDWWILHSDITDSQFLYYLIQTDSYMSAANLSAGSKMPRSDWNLVSNTIFTVPSDKIEQQRIGTFFRTHDSAITLHQREVEKLTKLKKALLSKMFI